MENESYEVHVVGVDGSFHFNCTPNKESGRELPMDQVMSPIGKDDNNNDLNMSCNGSLWSVNISATYTCKI